MLFVRFVFTVRPSASHPSELACRRCFGFSKLSVPASKSVVVPNKHHAVPSGEGKKFSFAPPKRPGHSASSFSSFPSPAASSPSAAPTAPASSPPASKRTGRTVREIEEAAAAAPLWKNSRADVPTTTKRSPPSQVTNIQKGTYNAARVSRYTISRDVSAAGKGEKQRWQTLHFYSKYESAIRCWLPGSAVDAIHADEEDDAEQEHEDAAPAPGDASSQLLSIHHNQQNQQMQLSRNKKALIVHKVIITPATLLPVLHHIFPRVGLANTDVSREHHSTPTPSAQMNGDTESEKPIKNNRFSLGKLSVSTVNARSRWKGKPADGNGAAQGLKIRAAQAQVKSLSTESRHRCGHSFRKTRERRENMKRLLALPGVSSQCCSWARKSTRTQRRRGIQKITQKPELALERMASHEAEPKKPNCTDSSSWDGTIRTTWDFIVLRRQSREQATANESDSGDFLPWLAPPPTYLVLCPLVLLDPHPAQKKKKNSAVADATELGTSKILSAFDAHPSLCRFARGNRQAPDVVPDSERYTKMTMDTFQTSPAVAQVVRNLVRILKPTKEIHAIGSDELPPMLNTCASSDPRDTPSVQQQEQLVWVATLHHIPGLPAPPWESDVDFTLQQYVDWLVTHASPTEASHNGAAAKPFAFPSPTGALNSKKKMTNMWPMRLSHEGPSGEERVGIWERSERSSRFDTLANSTDAAPSDANDDDASADAAHSSDSPNGVGVWIANKHFILYFVVRYDVGRNEMRYLLRPQRALLSEFEKKFKHLLLPVDAETDEKRMRVAFVRYTWRSLLCRLRVKNLLDASNHSSPPETPNDADSQTLWGVRVTWLFSSNVLDGQALTEFRAHEAGRVLPGSPFNRAFSGQTSAPPPKSPVMSMERSPITRDLNGEEEQEQAASVAPPFSLHDGKLKWSVLPQVHVLSNCLKRMLETRSDPTSAEGTTSAGVISRASVDALAADMKIGALYIHVGENEATYDTSGFWNSRSGQGQHRDHSQFRPWKA